MVLCVRCHPDDMTAEAIQAVKELLCAADMPRTIEDAFRRRTRWFLPAELPIVGGADWEDLADLIPLLIEELHEMVGIEEVRRRSQAIKPHCTRGVETSGGHLFGIYIINIIVYLYIIARIIYLYIHIHSLLVFFHISAYTNCWTGLCCWGGSRCARTWRGRSLRSQCGPSRVSRSPARSLSKSSTRLKVLEESEKPQGRLYPLQ